MSKRTIVVAGGVAAAVLVVVVATTVFMGSGDDQMTMGDGQTMATSDMPDTSSGAAPFDRAFIDAMVPHHRSAIAMANAALEAGLDAPELRTIAESIVDTQQGEIDNMLDWRLEWYGSTELDAAAGTALGMSMDEMGMGGDPEMLMNSGNVDADFARMMIVHHEGAIAMARMASERAERQEIRTLAQAVITAQEDEIMMMEPLAG